MPVLSQVSFTGGEIAPELAARVDLARYSTALRTCSNFFVRPTGGISNRPGLYYVATLDSDSLATLIPFVFSTEQAYMLVLQEFELTVYADGNQVPAGTVNITNVTDGIVGFQARRTITTATAHGLNVGQTAIITGVTATGTYDVDGSWEVLAVPSTTSFRIQGSGDPSGAYGSGGTVAVSIPLTTTYASEDLAAIRYTQSADVATLVHPDYEPSEVVRLSSVSFTFGTIDDLDNGPWTDTNETITTVVTASAATGTGITLTASSAIFESTHVGALFRLDMEDLSTVPPWEASKRLVASGGNPLGLFRRSTGKVYECVTDEVAGADGTYTGTVRPTHDEGVEEDGDGNAIVDLATRAGVEWEYRHSLFGVARITAVALDGLTATADVLSYLPVVTPATSSSWAFGAWSEDQGYPSVVTYFGDRLAFANTPQQPQTEWLSKVGEYHDFGQSSPIVDDDAITQTLNAKQVNAIVELVPLEQLVALTASSSWASPQRGEVLVPETIGYYPQSYKGAADLRSVIVGENALYAQRGSTKLRELRYTLDSDKYGGDELSVLSRHLFGPGRTIVDLDYAEEPHGILWIVRSDGALIGLTYLPEQQVIGWHRHETDGFFERVCVIPEDDRDVPYFVVRRDINGTTYRFLERMADREFDDQLDGFFVDCGLSYDGRNTSDTTITITGASYDGGETVTLTASSAIFASSDTGDAIQFDQVRIRITAFTSTTVVTGQLETPVSEELQNTASTEWTFARDTFTGLDHLEGATVAICADGAVLDEQVVSSGTITIDYPAGVVHIGLPYEAEAETLDVTVYGAPQTVRDVTKNIPSVTVVVDKTVGLQVGPDSANMETLAVRNEEFYTDPTMALSGVAKGYVLNTWDPNGRMLFRQPDPLPATILAVLPDVQFGESG